MRKRLLAGFLMIAMLVCLFPANALAAERTAVSITAEYFNTQSRYTLAAGTYNVTGEVIATGRIVVNGEVVLNLETGCHLRADQGIQVAEDYSLTISGSGQLTAVGRDNNAAIGGNAGKTSGAITITGGHVIADGSPGSGGAGIGGGSYGKQGGQITIAGGHVEAKGANGAAIGSGYIADGGIIEITGGTVVAATTGEGDAIGGGATRDANSVTISGENTVVIASIRDNRAKPIGTTQPSAAHRNSGLIIENSSGKIYGGHVTILEGIEIPEGVTLTIPENTTLTIPSDVILTNSGMITNNGAITGDGQIALSSNATIQTGNSPKITVGVDATATGDGSVAIPSGGSAAIQKDGLSVTVTVPSGGGTIIPQGGGVEVPPGCAVRTESGPELTVNSVNGTVGTDGSITVGTGGSVTVQGAGGSLTISGTGTYTPKPDGGVTVPGGSQIELGAEPKTTVTLPVGGGEVKPTTDGGVSVPEGATVKPGGGPEITVGPGNGGAVGNDGGVTVPGGGKVTVKGDSGDTTITLPSGGTVKPNPDGTISLPGGSTIEKGGTTTTVPDTGGAYNPSTGAVTGNVHTVTFNSQGGSAVGPKTAAHGGTVINPGNPTRSGYTFGGWYKESSCTNAWNFAADTVTGDITLYAKWTAVTSPGDNPGGNYTPPTYPPTVGRPNKGGGAATVSPSHPGRGDTVTVTAKPDTGYEVDKITVTDQSGKPVAVTAKPDGTYTFIQPTGKVKIEVSYKPVEKPWTNPFADVEEGAWYYDAVRFVSENGLMDGYGNGRFGVNSNLSRAQLAQILFNKEGRPVVNYLLQYGDVDTSSWYAEAVRWATSQGIVDGYENGDFGPNNPITREQLAVMLWRYAGSCAAAGTELDFIDAGKASGYAEEALRWAVENGIIRGYNDGRLDPRGLATRAQAAQMLMNFLNK